MSCMDMHQPSRADVFQSTAGNVGVHFIDNWCNKTLLPAMFSLVIMPIYKSLTPEDQKYFRESREAKFGVTLEQASPSWTL